MHFDSELFKLIEKSSRNKNNMDIEKQPFNLGFADPYSQRYSTDKYLFPQFEANCWIN